MRFGGHRTDRRGQVAATEALPGGAAHALGIDISDRHSENKSGTVSREVGIKARDGQVLADGTLYAA